MKTALLVGVILLSGGVGCSPKPAGLAPLPRKTEAPPPARSDSADTSRPEPAGVASSSPIAPAATCPSLAPDQHGAATAYVFIGEYLRSEDEEESGYGALPKWFHFRPLAGWFGVFSNDEIQAARHDDPRFPRPDDPPPVWKPGQKVFVRVTLGGMTGRRHMLEEGKPVDSARKEIEELGPPCWTRETSR